jgi:hypothetical protein
MKAPILDRSRVMDRIKKKEEGTIQLKQHKNVEFKLLRLFIKDI